jgi:hypothetical protein
MDDPFFFERFKAAVLFILQSLGASSLWILFMRKTCNLGQGSGASRFIYLFFAYVS